MYVAAAILFAIAAVGGLTMAWFHFKRDRNPPNALAALHGVFAAVGLVVLIWAVFESGASTSTGWALALFVLAALGGFYLLSHDLRGRRLPSPVLVIHALVAVVAFVLLLVGIAG